MELGGKSPCYVADDCNLPVALRRILWGKATNMGQTCIAPDYLLCSETMKNKIIDHMPDTIKSFYGKNPKVLLTTCTKLACKATLPYGA